MTVWLLVLLLEGSLVELLEAEGAEKVLWVELSEHGRDAPARDGLVAAGAEGTAHGVVVGLAVGEAFVLEEVAADKRLLAIGANKAVRVPLAVQGRDVVLGDGLGAAAALGSVELQVAILQKENRCTLSPII